jgi:hypothetical protein
MPKQHPSGQSVENPARDPILEFIQAAERYIACRERAHVKGWPSGVAIRVEGLARNGVLGLAGWTAEALASAGLDSADVRLVEELAAQYDVDDLAAVWPACKARLLAAADRLRRREQGPQLTADWVCPGDRPEFIRWNGEAPVTPKRRRLLHFILSRKDHRASVDHVMDGVGYESEGTLNNDLSKLRHALELVHFPRELKNKGGFLSLEKSS